MDWRGRIVVDPAVLVGKPVLEGTRLAVEFAGVTDDDVRACLACAREVLQQERVFLVAQP